MAEPTAAERLLQRLDTINSTRNQVTRQLAFEQAQPLNQELAQAAIPQASQNTVDQLFAQAANAGAPTSAGFVAGLTQSLFIDPANQAGAQLQLEQENERKRIASLQTQLQSIDSQAAATQQQFQNVQSTNKFELDRELQREQIATQEARRETEALNQSLTQANIANLPEEQRIARETAESQNDFRSAQIRAADASAQAARSTATADQAAALVAARRSQLINRAIDKAAILVSSDRVADMAKQGRSVIEIKNALLNEDTEFSATEKGELNKALENQLLNNSVLKGSIAEANRAANVESVNSNVSGNAGDLDSLLGLTEKAPAPTATGNRVGPGPPNNSSSGDFDTPDSPFDSSANGDN